MAITAFSTLPEETELLLERTIGCAIAVHRQLGPGFQERIYSRALCIELELAGIPYERERSLQVEYRGRAIGVGRVDLLVGDAVIVEVKATNRLDPIFQAQLMSYLRASKLRAGLLINFNAPLLKEGIKRIWCSEGVRRPPKAAHAEGHGQIDKALSESRGALSICPCPPA